jgi:hypothetical protein
VFRWARNRCITATERVVAAVKDLWNGSYLQKVRVFSSHRRKAWRWNCIFKTNTIHSSGTESRNIIEDRRFALETEAKHAAMNTAQGCHSVRLPPTRRPCPSNLTPSSLSMRIFQSQWNTGERLLELGSRLMLFSTEPSDCSVRGDDSVARDERSEGVICESGPD